MIKNRLSIILGEQRMRVSELSKLTGISQNALNKIYHRVLLSFQWVRVLRLSYRNPPAGIPCPDYS